MKFIFSFVLYMCTVVTLCGQISDEVTIPLSDPNAAAVLDIDVKKGSIVIIGSDRKDILVNYTIPKKKDDADQADASSDLSGMKKISSGNIDVRMSESDNTVEIKSGSWFERFDLELEVPRDITLDVGSYMGESIEVSNISGRIELESYNGEIVATGISGSVNASTYNGVITIDFDEITPDVAMAFSNYNGVITVTVPDTYKANLKMKTMWGDIFSNLDLVMSESTPALRRVSGEDFKLESDEWTRATLNGGGPEVMIKNFTGGIRLRKK